VESNTFWTHGILVMGLFSLDVIMNITIYSKKNCPNCTIAKQLLESKGLNYKEIDIEVGDRLDNFVANYPEAKQMPQIWVGDQRVGGLAGLQAALKQLEGQA